MTELAGLSKGKAIVWAALALDGEHTTYVLKQAGVECNVITSIESLERSVDEHSGVIIVAAELLTHAVIASLKTIIAKQRPWSELALVIMADESGAQFYGTFMREIYEAFHLVIFLSKPLFVDTFVEIIKGVLLEHRRCYDVRVLLERNEQELASRRIAEKSLRLSNQQLSASEAKFRRLLDTANEGVLTTDHQGRIEYSNQRMIDMLFYSQDEIQGKFLQDIVAKTANKMSVVEWINKKCASVG